MNFIHALITLFSAEGKQMTIRKGDYLLREGETEHHIYYIKEGAVRASLLSDTEEITIRFGYDGSIINSLTSFITGQPSALSLQAIRQTRLEIISKTVFQSFVQTSEQHILGYNNLLEQTLVQQIERETDLLTNAPAERLDRVLQRSPDLFQHIPLKYIASYLRMTPETLSRIRKS